MRQDVLVVGNCLGKLLMLVFDLFTFKSGQPHQPHVQNRLSLTIIQRIAVNQLLLGNLAGLCLANDFNDLVNMIKGNQKSLHDMIATLRFFQVKFRPPPNHVDLMFKVVLQNLLEA